MCGLVAIYAYAEQAPPVDVREIAIINESMAARGPDGAGMWLDDERRIGMGHRRLAIIDLSEAGTQPMGTADGRLQVAFNGEIYNYRQLRTEAEARGWRFRSHSDTEVLLALYDRYGPEMVHHLRGMYAFALWDAPGQQLFMARDPFGVKPLYYADDGATLRGASQVKALRRSSAINTSCEPAGHVGFFLWGYVPEPYTLFEGIRSLPAGCSLTVRRGGRPELRTFCSIATELAEAEAKSDSNHDHNGSGMRESLRSALSDSVSHHLVSDVPIGSFLSAGLDSTTVTALATEVAATELRTITLGFSEYRGTDSDETALAELAAREFGTSHQSQWVSKEEFAGVLDNFFDAMDQPTIDGANSYLVSLVTARAGLKVALSGLGGDELFAGYPSFRQIPPLVHALALAPGAARIGAALRFVSVAALRHFTSPKYAGLLEYGGTYAGAYLLRRGLFMPWELPEVLDADFVRRGWNELQPMTRLEELVQGLNSGRLKVTALEMTQYMRSQLLRDADWAAMAHSLEVRFPLADITLLRQVAPMLVSARPPGKADMASTPAAQLPPAIRSRDKTGFSVPMREWFTQANGNSGSERGLKSWARTVYANYTGAAAR